MYCIDYFLSDQYHGTPSAPEVHISDHIIQELQLDFQESRHPSVSLAPSPRIPPYPGSDAVWQRAANRVWCEQQQLVPQSWSQDLDQDWAQLSKTFFDTLLQTQVELVPETVSSVPAALLRRGRPDKVQIKTRDRLVKPTAGWFATFKERHLSNLLARLHEAQRMQNQARTSVAQAMHEKALWERIRRSQYYDPSKGIQMNIQIISRTLEQHTAQAERARFDRWTQKMQHDKHALKWLRQERSPLCPWVKVSPNTTPSGTLQESLQNLSDYWKAVWEREAIDIEALWDDFTEFTPAQMGPDQWPAIQVEHIQAAARRARGTAPGLDMWQADELCRLTDDMWHVFLSFFAHCETLGRIPSAWCNVRQIHLPKGKPPQPDGSILAADLRPLSVTSVCGEAPTMKNIDSLKYNNGSSELCLPFSMMVEFRAKVSKMLSHHSWSKK
jgi:hypothetical protein